MNQDLETNYLSHLLTFHTDRLKMINGSSLKCKDCDSEKILKQSGNKLIYDCGMEDDGLCGEQFTIELPKYYHYDSIMKQMEENIHGSFHYTDDIHDLSVYNIEPLSKLFPLKDELKEQEEVRKEIQETLVEYQKIYAEMNNFKEREKKIKEFYLLKERHMDEKNKIMKQIKEERNVSKKKELRKQYASFYQEEHKIFVPMVEELNKKNQEYIMIEPPKIHTYSENYQKGKNESLVKKKKEEIEIDEDNKGYQYCKKLSLRKIKKEDIKKYRGEIHSELIKAIGEDITPETIMKIDIEELKLMFELYDKYFFKNELSKLASEMGCKWVICWNHKCTTTAGRVWPSCKEGDCRIIKLELASLVFKKALTKLIGSEDLDIKLDKENMCNSVLTCLTYTFEHELVHALQECFCTGWVRSNKGPGSWTTKAAPGSGHSKTFMSILNNTFGHLTYKHTLFMSNDEYGERYEGKKKDKKTEFLIEKIMTHFKENDGRLTREDYEQLSEGYETTWGSDFKDLFRSLQKGKKSWKSKEQDKYGSIIKNPTSKDPDSIELTDEWRKRILPEEEPKKKGIGDELEDLQVEIIKGVSKAEQKKKEKESSEESIEGAGVGW